MNTPEPTIIQCMGMLRKISKMYAILDDFKYETNDIRISGVADDEQIALIYDKIDKVREAISELGGAIRELM
nr:MAG TPA: hypothetical protein [Bacteriophage sp.]